MRGLHHLREAWRRREFELWLGSSRRDAQFAVAARRGHQRKDDPRHTRTGDCKYPNAESSDWQCPGCKSNAHRSSNTHTLGPDCRWAIAATRDEGGGRARKGHHPRDPAVAASRDPTASLRLPAEPNVPVAGEAVEPERLSPEEAARRRALKRSSEVQVGSDPGLVDAAGAPVPVQPDL